MVWLAAEGVKEPTPVEKSVLDAANAASVLLELVAAF